MLHTASNEDIMEGRVTDVYFERTEQVLRAKGLNRDVRAEIVAKGLARDWEWAIFAGAVECASLFDSLPVDVRIMREGTLFHPFEPVAKRGKMSGAKQVYRCTHCLDSVILPLKSNPPQCPCGTAMEPILSSISHLGELGKNAAHAEGVRDYVLDQLELADPIVP